MSWFCVTTEETEIREYMVEAMTESEARALVRSGGVDDSTFVESVGSPTILRSEYNGPSEPFAPFVVPPDWPVQPIDPDSAHGRAALIAHTLATCGSCGLSWDDGVVSSLTPAPSARCPFESVDGHPS